MEILVSILLILAGSTVVTAKSTITSASVENSEGCTYRWFCSDWLPEECPENQVQTRKCTNAGDCSDDFDKPKEKQGCFYATIPTQLFDIELGLQKELISNTYELSAWVTFESFGSESTPVNLTYTILDEFGNVVYTKEDYLVVETERYVTTGFLGLELEPGEYMLVLETLYDVDVRDEFIKRFTLEEEKKVWSARSVLVVIFLVLAFLIGLMMFKRRKAKDKNSKVAVLKKKERRKKRKGEANK